MDLQIHLPDVGEASKSPESGAGHIVLSLVLCVSIMFYFKYIYLSGQPPARGELLSHDYAQVPLDRRFHGAGLDIFLVSRMFSDYGGNGRTTHGGSCSYKCDGWPTGNKCRVRSNLCF